MEVTATHQTTEWVERCKQGDARSYKALYDQYARAMYNTCLRILNDAAEAEDVLQEAFLDAFRKIHTFEHRSTFGAWLKRIVVNKAINQLRKRKMDIVDMERYPVEEVQDEKGPDEREVQWQVKQVLDAMQLLPTGYRTVLNLHLLEGYDYEEIAEELQISASTVRTQYMRAKQKLLGLLNQQRA